MVPDGRRLPHRWRRCYVRGLIDSVKSQVDARFRTRSDSRNTFTMGASMGGLISVYAGYRYDSMFGRIASVSGSLSRSAVVNFGKQSKPALDRFYLDAGTVDDNEIRPMRSYALAQGFQEGVDFRSVEADGHCHCPECYAERLPTTLEFLVGPP